MHFSRTLADAGKQSRATGHANIVDSLCDARFVRHLGGGHHHVDRVVKCQNGDDVVAPQPVDGHGCGLLGAFDAFARHRAGLVNHDGHIGKRSIALACQLETRQRNLEEGGLRLAGLNYGCRQAGAEVNGLGLRAMRDQQSDGQLRQQMAPAWRKKKVFHGKAPVMKGIAVMAHCKASVSDSALSVVKQS